MVFLRVKMSWNVVLSPDKMDPNDLVLHKSIILRLLEEFSIRKATEEYGFFVAVTTLDRVGDGKVRELTGDVLFPVEFSCVTLKPFRGEILDGTIDKVLKQGVFLKSGPLEQIYVHSKTMPDFKYIAGENPHFLSDKLEKLEKNTTVRFKVLGVQWQELDRAFRVLGTLASDFLGPIVKSS